jgi:hypothetical protein
VLRWAKADIIDPSAPTQSNSRNAELTLGITVPPSLLAQANEVIE